MGGLYSCEYLSSHSLYICMAKDKFKDKVSETLLIPLYMRAKESRRGQEAILQDPVANDIVERIDYDYSKFDGAKLSEIGCNVRCWYLDNVVKRFVSTHIHPVVVNLGCGLDARCQRTVHDDNTVFYSLDLPDVIDLREKLLPAVKGENYIASSLFDTDWMEKIREHNPDSDFLFVIEGVLMYFEERQIREFFDNLCQYFPGAEVWFDVCGSLSVKNQNRHDSLKTVAARFKWALDNGADLEKWNDHIHIITQSSKGMFFRWRYPLMMNLISRFPKLLFKFCSIVGYKFSK